MPDPSSAGKDLADISRRSEDVARYHDDWVEDYDRQLAGWDALVCVGVLT